jgi:proteic killer suppression protein
MENSRTRNYTGNLAFEWSNIVTFLQEMENPKELQDISSWKVHQLTGDRKGTWSLTVTRNWRMTFRIDRSEGEIIDLDYEDYH